MGRPFFRSDGEAIARGHLFMEGEEAMTNQSQVTRPEASTTSSRPPGAPAPGTTSANKLKREAAGEGFEAQEARLAPQPAPLTGAQVDDALRFNRKNSGKPDFVAGVQSYFGVAATGTFDPATVIAVAGYQGEQSLKVDGKVGKETRGALQADGVEQKKVGSAPAKNEAKPIGAPGAGGAETTPVVKGPATPAEVKTPETTPVAVEEKTATKNQEKVAAKADGETQVASGGAPPTSFGEGTTLSIAAFASWAEGAATQTEEGLARLAAMDPADAAAKTLSESLMQGAAALKMAGDALRSRAVQLINDASLLKRPEAQPTLPDRSELLAFSSTIRRLGKAGGAMNGAVAVCLDAVLAIQQGASVLSARATWAQKPREAEGATELEAQKKAKDDPLNAIFRDSGFAGRITTTKNSKNEDKVADWCGMFVGASLFRGGGLDEELRKGMLHTSNVLDYFQYQQVANAGRVPRSIWADGEWHDMKTYHGVRGSTRQWQSRAVVTEAMEGGGALDVRPGDVVLIDHSGKSKTPQHITMVESYDPSTHQLVTIEGNTGGVRAGDDGKVGDAGDGYHKTNATGRDGSGLHTRDMTNMSAGSRETHAEAHAANMERYKNTPNDKKAKSKDKAYRGGSGITVFGIGRPSAVDFEEHEYATKAVPEALKRTSPAEMDKKAKAKVEVQSAK